MWDSTEIYYFEKNPLKKIPLLIKVQEKRPILAQEEDDLTIVQEEAKEQNKIILHVKRKNINQTAPWRLCYLLFHKLTFMLSIIQI